MIIDSKNINEESLIASKDSFLKKFNNIYLTEKQCKILKNKGLDPSKYSNLSELIYNLEYYLNNIESYDEDLEWISEELSMQNYYSNTNK